MERYINVGGVLSETTMMELASFIPSAEVESERLAKENSTFDDDQALMERFDEQVRGS